VRSNSGASHFTESRRDFSVFVHSQQRNISVAREQATHSRLPMDSSLSIAGAKLESTNQQVTDRREAATVGGFLDV
jgi:hypothetical protein